MERDGLKCDGSRKHVGRGANMASNMTNMHSETVPNLT